MNFRAQRGSSLLLALVVVLVVSVLGVAMIRFASMELAGATAGRNQQELMACAEAGRKLLLSRFRLIGDATNLPAMNEALDGRTRLLGGHIDNVIVKQASSLPGTVAGPGRSSGDTWQIKLHSTGGEPTKVVVHCQVAGDGTPASGRQLEVEFAVKSGI